MWLLSHGRGAHWQEKTIWKEKLLKSKLCICVERKLLYYLYHIHTQIGVTGFYAQTLSLTLTLQRATHFYFPVKDRRRVDVLIDTESSADSLLCTSSCPLKWRRASKTRRVRVLWWKCVDAWLDAWRCTIEMIRLQQNTVSHGSTWLELVCISCAATESVRSDHHHFHLQSCTEPLPERAHLTTEAPKQEIKRYLWRLD